MVLNSENVS
jgi:hypothetical protein